MFDHLTEEIWKELGPVDPDWFQLLTTRASSREGNVSNQNELCPNQEGKCKTSFGETVATVAASQQFSTPKVFRRAYAVSPDTKDQQEDSLNLPQQYPVSYAQRISESLGADINPDISWTSSLNTPPLPSTFIFSKTEESPRSVTFSMDKSVVVVRKLFPSLSNPSRNGATSPQINVPPVFLHEADIPVAGSHTESQKSPHSSQEHSDGVCKKQVLDTIEDEAIRSPMASILDDAENSPSAFVTNTNLVLRKVKTERVKSSQEEPHSSSSDVSTESKPVPPPQGESGQDLCRDTNLTQWSPLSLSDFLATPAAKNDCNSGQPIRPSLNPAGFTRKKTKFIYTIDKEKYSLNNNSIQGHELSVTLAPKTFDKGGESNISEGKEELHQRELINKEKLPPLLQVNTQDLDMSLLCKAFAQDFSQMSHLTAPPKTAAPPLPRPPPPSPPPPPLPIFSPLACLTALKVAREKAKRQVGVHRKAPFDVSVAEVEVSDSGFLSGTADFSHVTLSCLEKPNPSDRCTLKSTSRKQNKVCLEELSLGTDANTKDTSMQQLCNTADLPCPPLLIQSSYCEKSQKIDVSLPSRQLSGFKTASNKSIQISAENLQKAEHLFDETIGQQSMKSVCDKEISSVVSRPVKVSTKCLWKDDENRRETEELPRGFPLSIKDIQNVPQSPEKLNTGTSLIDPNIRCDWYAKEEAPAMPSSAVSSPIGVSKNISLCLKEDHLTFELDDTEEVLQGSGSSVKQIQNAPKSPGNRNAVAFQSDHPIEYNLDAKEENPAMFALAPLGQKLNQANCKLTASEKADVKELCTLLEESDTQFEFTQFRTVKQLGHEGPTSSPKEGKDLDPDFLSGIDFDDSFCAEANEKMVFTSNNKTKHEEPNEDRKPPLEPLKKEASIERFQTANEGVRVSKKCLKKTKHLLDDLGWSTSAQKSSGYDDRLTLHERTSQEQNNLKGNQGFISLVKPIQISPKTNVDTVGGMHQGRFQMASGKTILISPRAMQKANAVFKDCIHENEQSLAGSNALPNATLSSCAKPNLVSSIDVCSSSSTGFSPAGGKKVASSAEPTAQVKCLLQKEHEDDQVKYERSSGIKPAARRPSGFQTAGGKQVSVSFTALKKAKSLLDDCDEVEEQPSRYPLGKKREPLSDREKPASFSDKTLNHNLRSTLESPSVSSVKVFNIKKENATTVDMNGPKCQVKNETLQNYENFANPSVEVGSSSLSGGGGFSTASGKKVSVSLAAVQKAKHILQDHRNDDLGTKKKHGCASGVEGVNHQIGGFQTGGGKQVTISSTALMKLKSLLDDYESVEEHPSHYSLSKKSQFLARQTPESFSDKALFDNFCSASESPALKAHDPKQANTASKEKLASSFSIADETNKKTYIPNKALRQADDYVKDQMNTNDGISGKDKETSSQVRINTLEVKFENVDTAPCGEKNMGHHTNLENHANPSLDVCSSLLSGGGGFCTASRKRVSVSEEALTRAKSLLNDIESNNLKPLRNVSLQNNKRDHRQNFGFQKASGRRVSWSSAALKKAKSFLGECHGDTADVHYAHVANSAGFNTASGGKVITPHEAIARAKSRLDESITDKDVCFQSPAGQKKEKNHLMECEEQDDKTRVKPSKIINCGFRAASGKAVSFSDEALHKAKALFDNISFNEDVQMDELKMTFSKPSVSGVAQGQSALLRERKPAAAEPTARERGDLHRQEMAEELDGGVVKAPEDPAVVNFESFDLTDCTETQQLFLAKEALDCTKALLVDEGLAMIENMQPQNDSHGPAEVQSFGKRSAEGAELDDQPPLKRRLLDEFHRSLDSREGSRLCPQTSSLNGLMKDRPAFKYNDLLRPNITKPHRDCMGYVEAAASQRMNQQPLKAGSTFFPEVFTKSEARSSSGNTKKPPAFVPPFKRQTAVEQRSTKHFNKDTKTTQNSEDPHSSISVHRITNHVGSESPPADTCWSEGMMLQNVELARDIQDMRIRKKKRQTVRPLPGSLFVAKTSGATRILLKDVVAGRPPAKYTQKQLYEYGVHRHVCNITSETAEAFRFPLKLFFKMETFAEEGSIQLADGGWLIPSSDGTAGKEQFLRALCDTPGVDPKLLSDEWVFNHYRWIVWKLASMERSFPETMAGLCLTPERVLLQLKYRYDVEVDHSRRPALRKIMEKDDTAAKALVLCVSGVVSRGQAGNPCAVVWLTDGWYAIKAQLDEPLTILLREGRLAVGGKLIVHSAQLVGSEDPCIPLEAPESLMLKIFANSSRPARWDAKLGFYKDPRPFLLPLSSLYSNGGPVGCVDIVVLRSYPLQWMERKNDGGVVFRLARAEEKEEARYNSHREKVMEVLYAKIQAELEKEDKESKRQLAKRTVSHQDIGGLQDGQELYEAVGDDLVELEAHLSAQQLETLRAYRCSLLEKKQAELEARYLRATRENVDEGQASCPQRDVTPVLRLSVADSLNPSGNIYQLNLWRPSSELQALLKEGRRYKVYNLSTSDRKKRGDVATLQLNATKKTQFQDLQTSPEWLSSCFQPRVSTNFVDLQNLDYNPVCREVDLTGCVVSVIDGQGASAFYLVDCNVNFVKVCCLSTLLLASLVDVVKAGTLLALSNLQLRGQSTRPTPVVYAGDLTVFSANPKEEHLQQALWQLKNLLQAQENFFVHAKDRLSQVLKSDVWSSVSSPSPSHKTATTQNTTPQQPIRSLRCFTPISKNLQSPANAASLLEKDPRSLKRKRAMDYLSRVPSPPPLFRLGPAASPSVKKTFHPPRRNFALGTSKTVHTPTPTALSGGPPEEDWVNDQELAMIDTQALHVNNTL
ncbi:breast cancer type 2 susceptibility protein [Syngnathoides biaculeatus]|uniref:breast cancer type 2 susceptibility protein n=1 Tax=Syngnathoides biaculeatus TaxID=300417 RepID=UPI002ADD9163|nr:breast cancer type 2 susceptibility protein [Syngnathoides biaculeatus]